MINKGFTAADKHFTAKAAANFVRERDKAVLSFDVKTFRHFYNKWTLLGYYAVPLPKDDNAIMMVICKMAYNTNSASRAEKEKAKKWLEERGFSTQFG